MAVYKRDMVDINLETGNIHRSFLKHSIGKADSAADHFGVRAFRNGEPVSLTGVSVQGFFKPPQGDPIAITSGNIVSENEAEVILPQACYNYEGQFCLAIKLIGGGVTGTVRIVDGMVDNTNTGGAVAPTETVPTYQEVLATYDNMVEALEDLEDYKDGIDAEVKGIDNQLKSVKNLILESENVTSQLTSGQINLSGGVGTIAPIDDPTSSNSVKYLVIECKAGESVTITCYGGDNARAWAILNTSKKILSVAAASASVSNLTLEAEEDGYFVVNALNSQPSSIVYTHFNYEETIEAINDRIDDVEDEIDGLETEIKGVQNSIVSNSYIIKNITEIDGATKLAGISFGTSGANPNYVLGGSNESYDSYYFYTGENTKIYFDSATDPDPAYIAVTVGYNPSKTWVALAGNPYAMSCTSPFRVRNLNSNLPTQDSPLDVSNAIVCLTVNATKTKAFHINLGKQLNSEIELASTQVNQVIQNIPGGKTNLLKYNSASNGSLDVYIPNVEGYVKYSFAHAVDNSKNADIWRVNTASHTDDTLTTDYDITENGEWEVAIKISGRDDFAGGIIHGDEVKTGIVWIVDGEQVDITAFTSNTPFENLQIIQQSNLYDPNDSTTIFAEHNSIHIFDSTGLTIRQYVKFTKTETITNAYMAMLPISKNTSNKIIPGNTLVPANITNTQLSNVSDVTIYKTGAAVLTRFYVPKFNFLDSITFLCADNGGNVYNKCYFVNVVADKSITSGTEWESETRYEFVAKNAE